jgi:hypothetical protein
MSVPLDRLYNFLHDISNHALLIYHWKSHGSKKLSDLSVLNVFTSADKSRPVMICHDQEPLFYELYTESDIYNEMLTRIPKSDPEEAAWRMSIMKFLSKLHLRGLAYFLITSMCDKILILHSEKQSKQLQLYESNNYIGVYYWSHAMIAADWFRYAQYDPKLVVNFDQIKKDFLIYNRAWSGTREYRLKFMHELAQQKLQSYCLTSFAVQDNHQNYADYQFKNSKFKVNLAGLDQHFLPNTHDSNASADYNNADYAQIGIEIVLETLFDDARLHLTEKTLRPIACGRPFILMATAGSLQYLRDYGFKTFEGLIDETYDTILDPAERLQAVVNEMSRIAKLDQTKKLMLWHQLYKIAKFNQQLFFSTQWQQSIYQEFVSNLSRSIGILEQHTNGVINTQLDQAWAADPASKIYS